MGYIQEQLSNKTIKQLLLSVLAEPGKPSKEKSFSKLMSKVVFVISGIQNPDRGKIREQALELGAQYKPDWGKGCTHLM